MMRLLCLIVALPVLACSSEVAVDASDAGACPTGQYMVGGECGTCQDKGEAPCRTADDVPGWCVSTWPNEPVEWRCKRWDAFDCAGVKGCTITGSACVAPDAGACPDGCCSTWHP